MDKVLDSTQLVSGIAVLLSFLAGYRYGVRNLDEQTAKSTAQNTTGNERVIFISQISINFCYSFGKTMSLSNRQIVFYNKKPRNSSSICPKLANEIICNVMKLVSQQRFLQMN